MKFIKKHSLLFMLVLSGGFAYVSTIFNRDTEGSKFSFFGPDIAEGASCSTYVTANGTASGTGTSSGTASGTGCCSC